LTPPHVFGERRRRLACDRIGPGVEAGTEVEEAPNPSSETVHPNCLGHQAIAKEVLKALKVAVPAGWKCS
jgi:hypothetical protein